jgi:hypothetical protein
VGEVIFVRLHFLARKRQGKNPTTRKKLRWIKAAAAGEKVKNYQLPDYQFCV